MSRRPVDRRAVLLAAAGLAGLAACTDSPSTGAASPPATTRIPSPSSTPSSTATTTATTATPTTTAPAPLPAARVYAVQPGEPEPQAKERAVRFVEAMTTWPSGQRGQPAAVGRVTALGIAPEKAAELVTACAPFLVDSLEATSGVISAQYGGIANATAAILVTFEQWTRKADQSVVRGGSAADVRLAKGSTGWEITQVDPAKPDPAVTPAPALVQAILTHPKIHLPPSAVADIAAGDLHPKAMQAMLDLAGSYEIDVAIVFTAHPEYVFATDRLSDHTRHRAFDVWAINGQPIIAESTPDDLVDGFMRATVRAGAYNVGGPRQLSGAAFFSDRTHADHVHVGFNADT